MSSAEKVVIADEAPVGGKGDKGERVDGVGRWAAATIVTALFHLGAFFLFRVPVPAASGPVDPPSKVAWIGQQPSNTESVIGEQLLLFDNAPLFLPTALNASAAENVGASDRAQTGMFDSFPTRLNVAVAQSPQMLTLLPVGVATTVGGLELLQFDFLSAFGRFDTDAHSLAPRLALIEVRPAFSGQRIESRVVRRSALAEDSSWPDWEPFEVLVDVDASGWQGPPLVVRGSGSAAVDAFFRSYIARELRVDLSYGPGYYRLLVGP